MTRNKQVYLAIGLAALAMLGLVGLQVYWIQNALNTNEERFNSQVAEALTQVNKGIEKRQTFYRSQDKLQPKDTLPDTAAMRRKLKSSIQELKSDRGIAKDSLKALLQPLKELIDSNRQSTPDSDTGKNFIEFTEGPDIKRPALKDTILDAFSKGFLKVFEGVNVFRKLARDLKQAGKRNDHQLEIDRLDSLVGQHLKNHGISAEYQIGVLEEPGSEHFLYRPSKVVDSLLLNSPHGTALFGSNIFTNSYQLKVYFPDKQWALLDRIKWMMGSSVIFLVLLVGTFAWISKHFFRQKQLSEIKTDFINNMTHELKTPISTISLATEALQDQAMSVDADQRNRFTQMINDENKRLSHQVERVLQMAKLEKGTFQVKQEELDVIQILNRVAENVQFRVEEKGGQLSLRQNIEKATVIGDEVHLTNVFQNLLDNAIKYAKNAPVITLRVGRYLNQLRVEVSDEGIGMTKEEQKNIFDKFYRVSNGNVHNVKGFGLGLSYVATIVKAHDGDIRVHSKKGKGSTFYLYLPLVKEKAEA